MKLSQEVREKAKHVARTWDICDPNSDIPADAAVQIAEAACKVMLAEVVKALREKVDGDGYPYWGEIHADFVAEKFA
jgi:hypothetical protein